MTVGTRERLLGSMVSSVAKTGYDSVTIADIVEGAGTSRSTFYEEFESKEECLYAAYDLLIEELMKRVISAYEAESSWVAGVRSGLQELLELLASQPEMARMVAVDVAGAGPEAHRRYRGLLDRFVPYMESGRSHAKRGVELPRTTAMMAVGAAEAIIFDEVVAGRGDRLPELTPEILFAVLVPYVGPEVAAEQMREVANGQHAGANGQHADANGQPAAA